MIKPLTVPMPSASLTSSDQTSAKKTKSSSNNNDDNKNNGNDNTSIAVYQQHSLIALTKIIRL